ncbi:MAG: PspC domain-containing protein [Bacteroidaceae bacterium]|nr:PspC domain-containing protein [Bacteroidaceae bacterium]
MKKTYNINLGGIVFHIDEDAYELLDKYLSNLRIHFSKEEGAEEIVHDMELRISELFSERLNEKNQVITLKDVEEIIAQMGKPEEFSEDATQDTNEYIKEEKTPKRLFRDPDNKVIGGVCSGIAAYFGWDVTILRILLIILAFPIFWNGAFIIKGIVLFYIIAWIIIPEANTATDKLSMKGMKVNVENIGKTVTDGFEKVNDYVKSDKPRSILHKIGEAIVSVVGFLVKAVLVIAAICFTPVLFILLVVCFSLLMAAIGVIGSLPAFFYHAMPVVDWSVVTSSPVPTTLLAVSGILVIGIPIVGFIHFLMSTFGGWKAMPFAARMTLLVLWLIALGVGTFFMINFGMAAIPHCY